MSGAHHGDRGGVTAIRSSSALYAMNNSSATNTSRSQGRMKPAAAAQRSQPAKSNDRGLQASQVPSSAVPDSRQVSAFPSANDVAQNELLKDAVFSDWKDDAGPGASESAEEMQKQDPLGTQIWKLYSKTKTRLPNQERMENLTWRMMALNLKRREREQAL